MNKTAQSAIAAVALATLSLAAGAQQTSPLVALGVISSDLPEQVMTQPTEIIRSKGTVYGWVALYPYHEAGTTRTVTVREMIDVPEPPSAWVLPGNSGLSDGGTHAEMTTTETINGKGLIIKPHTFLPGDPLGPWRIRLEIDGRPVGDFHFTVVAPPVKVSQSKKKEGI